MDLISENQRSAYAEKSQLYNALRLFAIFLFCGVLFNFYRKRRNRMRKLENLPSLRVRPYNILGHMSLLVKHYLFDYPGPFHTYYSILMTGISSVYGKDGLCLIWTVQQPTVLVFNANAVEMILSHSTELKKAWFYSFLHPWLETGLLTSDGPKWKQMRKLLTPSFHFNILKDFLPVFNKQGQILADDVLKNYTSSEFVDIVPLVTKCSFDAICETMLGEEMHSQTVEECDYFNSVTEITDVISDRILKPWLWSDLIFAFSSGGWKQRHHIRKVRKFATELISKKKAARLEAKSQLVESDAERESSKDDVRLGRRRRALLDVLLDEHIQNGTISEEGIRQEVDTFTFEGHDTTAMAMSWFLYLVGLYPDVQSKIHAELDSIFELDERDPTIDDIRRMKYLECVLKESLRLYPSVPGYGRQLQEDIEYKGYKIPKGCVCFVWAYLLHRDPEIFPEPEKFDPDRFSPENNAKRHAFAYVPFSAGPRNCIGQKFAMMEEKSILSTVLRKYKIRSLELRDRIQHVFEVVLRPFGGLKLQIRERKRYSTSHKSLTV